jgi:hypothetical protein
MSERPRLRGPEAPRSRRTKKPTFIERTERRRLRHGAASLDQEKRRGAELRDAEKYANERAVRAWWASCPFSPIKEPGEARAWEKVHGSAWDWAKAACIAARKDLRALWAKEDAKWATPLAPHITRITPDELEKIESETLEAKREAYFTEVQTLGGNARKDELDRFIQTLEQTSEAGLKTGVHSTSARAKKERQ